MTWEHLDQPPGGLRRVKETTLQQADDREPILRGTHRRLEPALEIREVACPKLYRSMLLPLYGPLKKAQ